MVAKGAEKINPKLRFFFTLTVFSKVTEDQREKKNQRKIPQQNKPKSKYIKESSIRHQICLK